MWLVIFASGIVAGGGVVLLVLRDRLLHAIHHPDEMREAIAARLKRTLDLNDQQARQVETILAERQQALQALRRRFQPEVEKELDRTERQISEVLSADQRAKWQTDFSRLRSTWVPPVPPGP